MCPNKELDAKTWVGCREISMKSAVPWGTVVPVTTPGLCGEGYLAGAVTFSLGIQRLPLFPIRHSTPQETEYLSPLGCEQGSGPP